MAKSKSLSEQFKTLVGLATRLAKFTEADALLVYVESPVDWRELQVRAEPMALVVASDQEKNLVGAVDNGLDVVHISATDETVNERLALALLECILAQILDPGRDVGVVAIYSAFEPKIIDTVSYIRLDEHLGRFTSRDLRNLESSVPLETLKAVVDLAVEIGREGREGKDVGTMFVVGDSRRVLESCHPAGFDPVKGYKKDLRNLRDAKTREALKEVSILDGAFVVSGDGTVEASCQIIEMAASPEITLSGGLGTRHWTAASITKKTGAVAVTVSQSGGTVRIWQDGKIMLRIEPFQHAMKWKADGGDSLGQNPAKPDA